MRRFSQRNSLVTLSDLNITPLLDLAFVLLIIFVITTPLLDGSLELKLPKGGNPDKPRRKEDFRTVEVGKTGFYVLGGHRMTLQQVESELVRDKQMNPRLAVSVRADKKTEYDQVFALFNMLTARNIPVHLASNPNDRR